MNYLLHNCFVSQQSYSLFKARGLNKSKVSFDNQEKGWDFNLNWEN